MGEYNKIRALYSDETPEYRFPMEPVKGDTITVRFRTLKNSAQTVWFVQQDEQEQMIQERSDYYFDYYRITLLAEEETIYYHFEIEMDGERIFYNRLGVSTDRNPFYAFTIRPGFSTPDWAKGAVMYQIFTDRFCNGDKSNDVSDDEYYYINGHAKFVPDWYEEPSANDVNRFYGGDLQGIIDKLDYLKDLGVDVLYLNPIFVSPSNHKYDIQDYDYVDPHFGRIVSDGGECLLEEETDNRLATKYIRRVTDHENLEASNQLFAELTEQAHKRGMRVILDGVFNHCGSFNKWLDRECIYEGNDKYAPGAYVSKDSPYRDFFHFTEEEWPYNKRYQGWWSHDTLPKLNYEDSENLEEYVLRIARKWVSAPYHADGWRLDVAADLGMSSEYNHSFWKKFRQAVKEANPQAVILAEHYGEARPWLEGDEWDTVMNYDAFMEPVTWFLTGMQKHSDSYRPDLEGNPGHFIGSMKHHMCNFQYPSLLTAMNELSNHDHSRFLTRTNKKVGRIADLGPEAASQGVSKAVFKEAVVIQMTWPGAPTIYYGDEAGLCGFTDPDNRRTYPWGREDQDLIKFHKTIIKIQKKYPVFTYGSLKYLKEAHQILCYGRFDKEEQMVVLINNNEEGHLLDLPVWEIGVEDGVQMERLILTTEEWFDTGRSVCKVENGSLSVYAPGKSAMIMRAHKVDEKDEETGRK